MSSTRERLQVKLAAKERQEHLERLAQEAKETEDVNQTKEKKKKKKKNKTNNEADNHQTTSEMTSKTTVTTTSSTSSPPTASAPIKSPAERVAELRQAWEAGLKSDDFKRVSRSFIDLFEALDTNVKGGASWQSQWPVILDGAQITLLRFSILCNKLDNINTSDETKDEFIFYRVAILLIQSMAALQLRKINLCVIAFRQIIQSIWERFEGLGIQGRQNIFIVSPIRRLLGTLIDAQWSSVAEEVIAALEQLLIDAGPSDAPNDTTVLPLPAIFRTGTTLGSPAAKQTDTLPSASSTSTALITSTTDETPATTDSDATPSASTAPYLLPEFLRHRTHPFSDHVREQAKGMGMTTVFEDVRLNLKIMIGRFRAMHTTSTRPDHERLTAASWLSIVNDLSSYENAKIQRPGSYSSEMLLEAASALEELKFLQHSATLIQRFEEFYQPITRLTSGEEIKPIDLLKLPYEKHMECVSIYTKLLITYIRTPNLAIDATKFPSNWPKTRMEALTRYNEYLLILQQRILSQQDHHNYLQSLMTQAHDLMIINKFNDTAPIEVASWSALKKTKEGIKILDGTFKNAESSPPQAWRLYYSFYAIQGIILSDLISPPQLTLALESMSKARQLRLRHHAEQKESERTILFEDARAYIHACILQLMATHTPKPQLTTLPTDLQLIIDLQSEFLKFYKRAAQTNRVFEIDAQAQVSCMNELDEMYATTSSTPSSASTKTDSASSASSSTASLSTLTGTQVIYVRSLHLLAGLERLQAQLTANTLTSTDAGTSSTPLQPSATELAELVQDLHRLGRLVAGLQQRDHDEYTQTLRRTADEINGHNQLFESCGSPACRLFQLPPHYSFLTCSSCQSMKYCSKDCQKADWKNHKLVCKKETTEQE